MSNKQDNDIKEIEQEKQEQQNQEIKDIFKNYVKMKVSWAENTVKLYIGWMKKINFGSREKISKSIRNVKDNYADKSFNSFLTALKNVRLALEFEDKYPDVQELIQFYEGERISNPEVQHYESYTKEEVKIIMNHARGYEKMALWFAINTGLRSSEIQKLNVSDIDLERGLIHVKKSKHNKSRIVAVSNTKPIEDYLLYRQIQVDKGKIEGNHLLYSSRGKRPHLDSGNLFKDLEKRLSDKGHDINVQLHRCRSTYITLSLRTGINIDVVKEQVGHESLDTTAGYVTTKLEDQIKQAKKTGLITDG